MMIWKTAQDCNGAKLYKSGVASYGVKYRVWDFTVTLRELDFPIEEVDSILEYVLDHLPAGLMESLVGSKILAIIAPTRPAA